MAKSKKSVKKILKSKTRKPKKSTKSIKKKSGKTSQAIAIVALILNIIFPGLGSLIAGKTKAGIWQLVLLLVGIPLSIILIGIPMIIAAWIWGIVTGVKLIQESQ